MKETFKLSGAIIYFSILSLSPLQFWWSFVLYFIFIESVSYFFKTEPEQTPEIFSSKISHFEKAKVKEAHIPLIDVVSIPHTSTLQKAIETVENEGVSRILIYKEQQDRIIGILHTHDLLKASLEETDLSPYIHKPMFIPEEVVLPKTLVQMQKNASSLCVVLDEFNQVSGIITLEDILEELVGEISDEHDNPPPLYKKIGKSSFLVSARMEIDEINDIFKWNLPKKDYESLGGFLMSQCNAIPKPNQKIQFNDLVFTVRASSKKNLNLIHIKKKDDRSNP
ncbi:MAG: CBS domain-containing protein [Deltaproteobacteria bacterium]|nr:CBS domain-containing protein [Deltaproteobacteria bacterium]